MTPEIESYYSRIFQAAVDFVPIDYERIWISSEAGDGFCGADIFIKSLDGSFFYTSEGSEDLTELIFQMHSQFMQRGLRAWTSATFSINSNGQFSVDFGYESLPDFDVEHELQRRETWINKHLGEN